jgi:hypothetical protein
VARGGAPRGGARGGSDGWDMVAEARAGGWGGQLRAREATPCHRGALGDDGEVDPRSGRPVDSGVPAAKEGTRWRSHGLLTVDGMARGAAPFVRDH